MARVQYFGKTTASTSVTVYWAGTTTKPTIYGSATGSSISNPLTSTFEGDYSFWVDEGHYKILNGKLVNGVATNIDDAYILSTQGAEPTASKSSLAPFQTNTATDVEEWVEGAYTGATYVAASALKSATTVVGVAAATAPSSGQVLTATSSTTATWQTPASGTPPGADTQVIFNDGGAYGADADLTYNKTTNTLTTTTFVGALTGNASTATTATNATNVGITNDTTTNATMYPVWVTANTGNLPAKVSSTKCTFNPSTGTFTATRGTFASLDIATTKITNISSSLSFEITSANFPAFRFNDNANYSTWTSSTAGLIDFPTTAGPVNFTATSGNQDMFRITKTFAPTSGAATFGMMRLTPTINQTGGASGVSRGLYIDPTITAAADFRAVEVTTGDIYHGGTNLIKYSANGAQWIQGQASELLTLSTSGTTTDTSANLLPANSIIEAVVARITTTITTATDWKLGDPTTAGRFTAANATMTAGTTDVGTVHVDQTGAAGPRQTAAAKVRVTTTGTPGAGAIRITVFYRQFIPPSS